jgi:hypothetical protein
VASAKEVLEWLGMISATSFGLIKFLLWKNNRKETSVEYNNSSSGNIVVIQVSGENNSITIPEPVYKLSKDPKVVEDLKTVVSPVSDTHGIDEATFIYNKQEQVKIDAHTANALREIQADSEDSVPQTFTAHIVVHGPILDPKSKRWKFKINNKVETIDIGETTIASDSMARGGISVGDTYKVKIEIIERKTASGAYVTDFKVKEVLSFLPGRPGVQAQFLPPGSPGDKQGPAS